MPVTKVCVVCRCEFIAKLSWGQIRNTCSKKCRYILTGQKMRIREIRICPECGSEFSTYPSSQKKLCSKECRTIYMSQLFSGEGNPNWIETKNLHPGNKKSLRLHIKLRDEICQSCGATMQLHVHHIDCDPRNNEHSNLLLLCKPCHAEHHRVIGQFNVAKLIMCNRTYKHLESRNCPICKKSFQPKRAKQFCCSPKCGRIQSGISRRKP